MPPKCTRVLLEQELLTLLKKEGVWKKKIFCGGKVKTVGEKNVHASRASLATALSLNTAIPQWHDGTDISNKEKEQERERKRENEREKETEKEREQETEKEKERVALSPCSATAVTQSSRCSATSSRGPSLSWPLHPEQPPPPARAGIASPGTPWQTCLKLHSRAGPSTLPAPLHSPCEQRSPAPAGLQQRPAPRAGPCSTSRPAGSPTRRAQRSCHTPCCRRLAVVAKDQRLLEREDDWKSWRKWILYKRKERSTRSRNTQRTCPVDIVVNPTRHVTVYVSALVASICKLVLYNILYNVVHMCYYWKIGNYVKCVKFSWTYISYKK